METMSRGGSSLPTSLSGGGLAHISAEVGQRSTWGDFEINRLYQQCCFFFLCSSIMSNLL